MRLRRSLAFLTTFLFTASLHAAGFSPLITLKNSQQTNMGLSPVHGSLLPDGRVMFFGVSNPDDSPLANGPGFEAALTIPANLAPFPATVSLAPENAPLECRTPGECSFNDGAGLQIDLFDGLFCSGHTLLEDGTLFTLSGTRFALLNDGDGNTGTVMLGTNYNLTYDAFTDDWNRIPGILLSPGSGENQGHGRWYGTSTRLHDGRILLTSGYDVITATFNGVQQPYLDTIELNVSTEIYNPADGSREIISPVGATPQSIFNPDYSHVFQLPWATDTGHDIVILGQDAKPVLMQADSASQGNFWEIELPRPGPGNGGNGASTLMLPLRINLDWGYHPGAMMMVGGGTGTQLTSADILDFGGGGWTRNITLDTERHHASTTILPDGKIFVVGGHPKTTGLAKPTNAVLIDPAQNFEVISSGQMATSRGYHTVSLLLPDGRVLVAGGRTGGTQGAQDEQPTMEIYSPPYLDAATRPVIDTAPDVIKNQQAFAINYHGADSISEIVLIGLGSMTHSFDQNTRSIQVYHVNAEPGVVWGYNVYDNRGTPPGMYMMFILDENRVPSVAKIIKVER